MFFYAKMSNNFGGYMENTIKYIETKIKALGLSLDTILDTIQKYVPQDVPEVADSE